MVGPTVIRVPSYRSTSSSITLSLVLPAISEWVPHELFPSMPPNVQYSWVAGSGPYVRLYSSAALRSWSQMTPGWTTACRMSGSSSTISL